MSAQRTLSLILKYDRGSSGELADVIVVGGLNFPGKSIIAFSSYSYRAFLISSFLNVLCKPSPVVHLLSCLLPRGFIIPFPTKTTYIPALRVHPVHALRLW